MIAKTSVVSDSARLEPAAPPALEAAPRSGGSQLSGWGRIPAPGREVPNERLEAVTRGAVLCRGLGRSYGDSSLPAQPSDKVVSTVLADRLLELDLEAGVLRAEAGLSLAEVNRLVMPHGWFPPVTPGTKFVTLGGMVASDVHGKNHHVAGCFGAHVRELRLRLADDRVLRCSPTEHADLFWASVGGMGLMGHILEVQFQLQRIASPWISMESERIGNIDEYLVAFARTATEWPMTMGWIDCVTRGRALGRGILIAGRWATREEAPGEPPRPPREIKFPFDLPNWACNPLSVRAFNTAYYHRHLPRKKRGLVSPEAFFYPLDAILEWNRGYGSRGFTQYQCVLPRAAGAPAVREFMLEVTRLGAASPVCVIKDCGPQGQGLLSFPLEGTSIAIDMAVSSDTQRIVDRLNDFVVAAGGRVYLTKDRFTRAEHYRAMEPRLPSFQAARDKWDPERRLRSAQSVRLLGGSRLKAVVLGGTSGMGRSLARRLAARGDAVFLLGNEPEELARSAADLAARHSIASGAGTLSARASVGHAPCDLEHPEGFAAALDAADAALGGFDTVIVTAAMFASQAELEQNHELARRLVTVNYAHTVIFCELVRERLLARGGGRLTVFSSVAGDRGRKPVGIYGSSKAGLSVYLEALDHKYHAAGLSVLCVKPGFVKTAMTAGLKPPPFAGEPDQVAKDVLGAMERRRALLYTPRMWALVMLVIRLLPRFVMRKIGF